LKKPRMQVKLPSNFRKFLFFNINIMHSLNGGDL
jgi:hypothetical protein